MSIRQEHTRGNAIAEDRDGLAERLHQHRLFQDIMGSGLSIENKKALVMEVIDAPSVTLIEEKLHQRLLGFNDFRRDKPIYSLGIFLLPDHSSYSDVGVMTGIAKIRGVVTPDRDELENCVVLQTNILGAEGLVGLYVQGNIVGRV